VALVTLHILSLPPLPQLSPERESGSPWLQETTQFVHGTALRRQACNHKVRLHPLDKTRLFIDMKLPEAP
jgi:hypothetical protein